MNQNSIQHYVSKMFIRRFMNERCRLHTFLVDTSKKGHGTLKKTFGEKELWNDNIEQKIGILETRINKILLEFDNINIDEQHKNKCTVWSIHDLQQKNTIIKMVLLQPNLLKDLKNGENVEKNILDILEDNDSSIAKDVFYVKLYKKYCNGKFIITDYLGQAFLDELFLNSIPTVTIEELKSRKVKSITKHPVTLPANYLITGEYEFFFIGKKVQLDRFLNSLMKPTICFIDKNGKEYEYKKKSIDFFEITTFNLNEIKSQESQCEIASYDEEYFKEIKKILPSVLSTKVVFRELKTKKA